MYKKLVKLNQYGFFTEVDPIELERTAKALKAYLENDFPSEESAYDVRDAVLPLCVGVLEGTLPLPLDRYELPYRYPELEDVLPARLIKLYRGFRIAATGIAERLSEPVVIDGERYCERIFEEPGDWPDKVAKWEDDRRHETMGDRYVPITR